MTVVRECARRAVSAHIAKPNTDEKSSPIDQPTTPNAFPFARTSSGKVSVGYTQGIVSHVAPKMKVYMNTKSAAAPPYCADFSGWSFSSRANAPARMSEMPWPTAPHQSPTRRPRRSMVATARSVLSMYVICA